MIYLFWGENHYAKQARIDELVEAHKDNAVERLDGESMDASALQNLTAQSLFAHERIVIISSFSLNKNITQLLTEVIERIPDTTDVIFNELSVKKNTSFFKLLNKHGEAQEFKPLSDGQVAQWAAAYASEKGGEMSRSVAEMLVRRAGRNQLLLKHEIDKLMAHDPRITKDALELLVEQKPEDNVFDLLDLIGKGNAEKARDMYRELRKSQAEPHYVMSMICWQLSNMATVVAHSGKTAQQIAGDAGISPYVAQKSMSITRSMSLGTMQSLLTLAAEADLKLKKSAAPSDQVIEQLIDRLSVETTS